MKKRVLSLSLMLFIALASVFALASCDLGTGGTPPCVQCADENGDHKCDVCKKTLSSCEDEDSNHLCDVCTKALSACEDENSDQLCDICGGSVTSEPNPEKPGTEPDTPGQTHQCIDENKDHVCDDSECKKAIGEHLDADKNHVCDYGCSVSFGKHEDIDKDHICDYGCQEKIGICADDPNDGDHVCDHGCGEKLSECADVTVLDGFCDDCGVALGTGGANPEPTTSYLEYVESLKFNDAACPVWRVAISPDYDPYIFVSRALAKEEWFCGSEILFILRLAREMNYKVQFVPLPFEDALYAIENGVADAVVGALGVREEISASRSNAYDAGNGERFYVYTSDAHTLSMVNKAIDFINAEGVYALWLAAANEYIESLPEDCVDVEGYDASGNKIGGDQDNLCAHKDTNSDHKCDDCKQLLSYCSDSNKNGDCDICGGSLENIENPAATPVYLGMAYTADGTYRKTSNVFFHSGKLCTVYFKFTNAVTIQSFSVAGSAVNIETVQSQAGAYIYAVSFTVNNVRIDGGSTGVFYKDAFGESQYLTSFNYYRIFELVGMADENGTLLSGAADVFEGAPFTLRFVTLGALTNFSLYLGDTPLSYTLDYIDTFSLYGPVAPLSYGETDPYYIYTVTVTNESAIPLGTGEITLCYDIQGTQSGPNSIFPHMVLAFHKHPANGEGGDGGEISPPCISCTDGDGDGSCDACGSPVASAPHDCTDEEDYDGSCDICQKPIEGIESLQNPYMIGYSAEPNGPFEEGSGTLLFEYGKRFPIYIKFNCPVELLSLSILETPITEWELYSKDESGCTYYFWTPDIDRIFDMAESEIFFQTPYSSECFATISYSCIPSEMPEFLGMVENGEITQNAPSILRGYSYTFSFALNVSLDSLDSIRCIYGDLEITDWSCSEGDTSDTYIYTVTVSDSGSITDGAVELWLYYTYLGASNHESNSAFPPVFSFFIHITEPTPGAVTVNGTDLNVVSQIPYSDSYLFSVIFDVPPTDATIEIDGVTYYGNEDFTLPGTYHFVVNNLFSGYKEFYIFAHNGDYTFMPVRLNIEILEQGSGGGNEGDDEIGGEGTGGENNPPSQQAPEILWLQNAVTEQPVEKDGIIYALADGKIAFRLAFDREVAQTYFRANGDGDFVAFGDLEEGNTHFYSLSFPMSMSSQEGTLEIIVYENDQEISVATYTYKIAAAAFYGLYATPGNADIVKKPSGIEVKAGEDATFFIAMTAAVDPTRLFIALGGDDGIDLVPAHNPFDYPQQIVETEDGIIHIFFYRVEIPAEHLLLGEDETQSVHKIAFITEQGDSYENIWMTYTVNFSR